MSKPSSVSNASNSYGVPPGVHNPSRRTIVNPIAGESIHFTKYGYETNGEYAEAILTCKPGGGPPLHYHLSYAERFEAIEGDLLVQVGDGPLQPVKPGEILDVPIRTPHRFSAGLAGAKFKGSVFPADEGFEQSLYILFGLAQDGEVGDDGLPKSLIHTAVVGSLGGMQWPGASGLVVNAMTGALASYARWSGVQDDLVEKYWS